METMVQSLHKTLYIYKGVISYPVKLEVIQAILNTVYIKDAKPDFRKKMRYLADECITNIINYYTLHKLSDKPASVKVWGSGQKIEALEFENYILLKDVPLLKEKINSINEAEAGEKKSLFVNALEKELDTGALGAGLGLLTLKQKLNVILKPSFTKTEDGFCKFKLKVQLPAN